MVADTPKQGQYLAFIHLYTRLHRRPPAETDMQQYMQQYFRVSPPSVHQMVLTLERRDPSEDSQEQLAASNCSLFPNCCPNYFERQFNQSKPLCRGTS